MPTSALQRKAVHDSLHLHPDHQLGSLQGGATGCSSHGSSKGFLKRILPLEPKSLEPKWLADQSICFSSFLTYYIVKVVERHGRFLENTCNHCMVPLVLSNTGIVMAANTLQNNCSEGFQASIGLAWISSEFLASLYKILMALPRKDTRQDSDSKEGPYRLGSPVS